MRNRDLSLEGSRRRRVSYVLWAHGRCTYSSNAKLYANLAIEAKT